MGGFWGRVWSGAVRALGLGAGEASGSRRETSGGPRGKADEAAAGNADAGGADSPEAFENRDLALFNQLANQGRGGGEPQIYAWLRVLLLERGALVPMMPYNEDGTRMSLPGRGPVTVPAGARLGVGPLGRSPDGSDFLPVFTSASKLLRARSFGGYPDDVIGVPFSGADIARFALDGSGRIAIDPFTEASWLLYDASGLGLQVEGEGPATAVRDEEGTPHLVLAPCGRCTLRMRDPRDGDE